MFSVLPTTLFTTPIQADAPSPDPSSNPWHTTRLADDSVFSLAPGVVPKLTQSTAQSAAVLGQPRRPASPRPATDATHAADRSMFFDTVAATTAEAATSTVPSGFVTESGDAVFSVTYAESLGFRPGPYPDLPLPEPVLVQAALAVLVGVPSHCFVYDVTTGAFIGAGALRAPYASTPSSQDLLSEFLVVGSRFKRLELVAANLHLRGRISACFGDELARVLQEYRWFVLRLGTLAANRAAAAPGLPLSLLELSVVVRPWARALDFVAQVVGVSVITRDPWDLYDTLNAMASGPALLRHLDAVVCSPNPSELAPLASRLLAAAALPVLGSLEALIFEGRVVNPDGELPLLAVPDAANGFSAEGGGRTAWTDVVRMSDDPETLLPPFLHELVGPASEAGRALALLRALEPTHYVFEDEARFKLTLSELAETEDAFREALAFHVASHKGLVAALRESLTPDLESAKERLRIARQALQEAAAARTAAARAREEVKREQRAAARAEIAAAQARAAAAAAATRAEDEAYARAWKAEAEQYARARAALEADARDEIRAYYAAREAALEAKIARAEWRTTRIAHRPALVALLEHPSSNERNERSGRSERSERPFTGRRYGLWATSDVDPAPDVAPSPDVDVPPSPNVAPSPDVDATPSPNVAPSPDVDATPSPNVASSPNVDATPSPNVASSPNVDVPPSPDVVPSPNVDATPSPNVAPSPDVDVAPSPNPTSSPAPDPAPTTPPSSTSSSSSESESDVQQHPTDIATRIATQVRLVNRAVLYMVMHPLQLEAHLASLRGFLLMGDGAFAHTLRSLLFDRLEDILRPRPTQLELDLMLDAAVAADRVDARNPHVARLSPGWDPAVVTGGEAAGWSPYAPAALDGLVLTYTVPPPLDIVLDADALAAYQAIHSLFLRVERAGYILHALWHTLADAVTRVAPSSPTAAALRRLLRFRAQMAHFVSIMKGYLTSQILDSAWPTFIASLASRVDSLDDLAAAHATFVSSASARCLLSPPAKPVKAIIDGILTTICKFYELVGTTPELAALSPARASRFDSVGDAFAKYAGFLFTLLSKLVVRGHQPHLDDLLVRLDFNGFFSAQARGTV